jgi:endonuclease YncB( thermonuclease family)
MQIKWSAMPRCRGGALAVRPKGFGRSRRFSRGGTADRDRWGRIAATCVRNDGVDVSEWLVSQGLDPRLATIQRQPPASRGRRCINAPRRLN